MDIIDILVARALTPQGQIDTYAAKANKAVSDAAKVLKDSQDAMTNITDITEQTNTNNTNAAKALDDANAALDLVSQALDDIEEASSEVVDTEIKKLILSLTSSNNEYGIFYNLITTYPDNTTSTLQNLIKYYNSTGQNTDGTMTQKAISDKFAELQEEINNKADEDDSSSFNSEDAGHIPVVQSNGNLGISDVTESDLIEALAKLGIYHVSGAVGLTIDYESRTFKRVQEATNEIDFDDYLMYGGRKRCNVNSMGQIVAWYGENSYKDDGSNGDVMVYQPKFYYQRIPLKTSNGALGKIVRQETISVSYEEVPGFKIHPAFVDTNGNILDYILLPAYESCYYDSSAASLIKDDSGTIDFNADTLRSCSNAKPVSGLTNQLTVDNAEQMAKNHGIGWHITNAAAESANQMLMLIELGTLNCQNAIESGVSNVSDIDNYNCASQTGSTASLGNTTGAATSTTNITNGTTNVYDNAGRRAISYRGMENPWGNMWRFIGGLNIYGNGASQGGIPYICTDFNYTPAQISNNYESAEFCLPSANGWVSAMGYGNEKYDWLLMPAETSGANSALPVGDSIWVTANLNGVNVVGIGGSWQQQENNGIFYYACDNDPTRHSRTVNARLMHIPIYNDATYIANVTSWTNKMKG